MIQPSTRQLTHLNNFFAHYDVHGDIVGRDNLIIALGDSWVAGDGAFGTSDNIGIANSIADNIRLRKCQLLSYPIMLADMLGKNTHDYINLSYPGGSNDLCSELLKTFIASDEYDLSQYDKIIVVFGFTSGYRKLYVTDNHGTTRNKEYVILHTKLKQYVEELSEAYLKYSHPEMSIFSALNIIYEIQLICDTNNFTYFFSNNWVDGFDSALEESNDLKQYQKLINWDNYTNKALGHDVNYRIHIARMLGIKNIPLFSSCGHPNVHGYRIIADHLYEIIREHIK